ncbi:DpnD/PcfM family protein [Streptomyces sp. NPDC004111]|uniref:DpnD/PcfM family protein n=1 Tax=Streptomyces sp. NPDC004111 TaxID=3364690 RepID=UPI0036A4953A
MAEYLVTLVETVSYEVRVTAEDRDEAEELASDELCSADDLNAYFDSSTGFEVDDVRKIKARKLVAA